MCLFDFFHKKKKDTVENIVYKELLVVDKRMFRNGNGGLRYAIVFIDDDYNPHEYQSFGSTYDSHCGMNINRPLRVYVLVNKGEKYTVGLKGNEIVSINGKLICNDKITYLC
jgi:hypothetical protein